MSLANRIALFEAQECRICHKPLGKASKSIVELNGKCHVKCWQDWARNDPDYQREFAAYKADPHPNYWMLNPDDADKDIGFNSLDTVVLHIQ